MRSSPPVTPASAMNEAISMWSGAISCSQPRSRSTPLTVSRLEPIPWMSAPIFTSRRARSCTWGSQAALCTTVAPGVSAAAMSTFSVAITDGSSMNTSPGRSPPSVDVIAMSWPKSTSAASALKASRGGSRRRRPTTSPPGGGMGGAVGGRWAGVTARLVEIPGDAWGTLFCEGTGADSRPRHMRGGGAAMRAYARRFGEDEELWGTTGLLHDLDYERYPSLEDGHPRYALRELEARGYPAEVVRGVASHADFLGVPRESRMEKTLYAVDELCS